MNKLNRKEIVKDAIVFVSTVVFILGVLHFIRFPTVKGDSMEPTYSDGDTLVTLYTNDVTMNDIVVVWCNYLDEYIVKRVIGVEGDLIEIKNGYLYRNGYRLYESYLNEQSWYKNIDYADLVVPEGEVFVLGDNRANSSDSRMFGTLPKDAVFGKVIVRIKK